LGVFGPLMMAGWVGALLGRRGAGEHRDTRVILAAFSAPVFFLVVIQAFISEANANGAAPAYVAAVPLAVATLVSWWRSRLLWVSLSLAGVAMIALSCGQISPALADRAGLGNALKRQEGWRELGAAVAAECRTAPYDAIAAANRSVLAELLYYARPRVVPIRAWDRSVMSHDHFQMTIPLRPSTGRVLVVAPPNESGAMLDAFESHRLIRHLAIPLGRHQQRVLALYIADFYRGPQIAR